MYKRRDMREFSAHDICNVTSCAVHLRNLALRQIFAWPLGQWQTFFTFEYILAHLERFWQLDVLRARNMKIARCAVQRHSILQCISMKYHW